MRIPRSRLMLSSFIPIAIRGTSGGEHPCGFYTRCLSRRHGGRHEKRCYAQLADDAAEDAMICKGGTSDDAISSARGEVDVIRRATRVLDVTDRE